MQVLTVAAPNSCHLRKKRAAVWFHFGVIKCYKNRRKWLFVWEFRVCVCVYVLLVPWPCGSGQ